MSFKWPSSTSGAPNALAMNGKLTDFNASIVAEGLSRAWLFVIPWTVARQAPQSIGFTRQEYWSGLPIPFPGNLPHPEIKLRSAALQADSLLTEPPGKPYMPL